jgi:hypothetical protein
MSTNRVPAEFFIVGDATNGSYESQIMDTAFERAYLGSIRFFDADGNQVTPSAGTVAFTMSTDGINFQDVQDGAFNATDAYLTTRDMPASAGPARKARITLTGVTGAVSFYASIARY